MTEVQVLVVVLFQNEDSLLPIFDNVMIEKKDRDAVILTDLLLNDVLSYFNNENGSLL